ncbi:YncE family protein [Ideonella sp. A 288]|uniref:YncE family protein n=1 Tax=Ideonella sp. A 288 TaxID=1962181 RepID=UPI000B4C0D22|nr:YncE family protein [Ideonella sp. A 288]
MSQVFRRSAACAALALAATGASAQLAVSANDNKVTLDNGTNRVVANAPPDTVSIIDLGAKPPRVLAELEVPTSVVGPPTSVAVAPDESFALVTRASKVDPTDPTKVVVDDTLTVIDLQARPPAVIATLKAGAGASGVSINKAGTLALVANRNAGTVSVFTVAGKVLTPAGTVKLGDDKSGPSHVVFAPDGKTALVTRDGDSVLSLLAIDGSKVESAKRDFAAGLRPYGADISSDGRIAVVANIGRNLGDADTISLIDLQAKPARVVETVTVGPTPEGIVLSPDGKTVAVVIHNGSGKAKESPFYNANGLLLLYRVDGLKLAKLAQAPIGRWSQGIAFSKDGTTILVQNMLERDIQVFRFDGRALTDTGQRIALKGGGAAIRTVAY